MVEYGWPAAGERRLLGTRVERLDGPAKVTGAARYTADLAPPGMLHARYVTCPHAHARVRSIDVSVARASPGVAALRVIAGAGAELRWAFAEVAVVAAETEAQAADAARAVHVEYEVLPHHVGGERRDDAPRMEARGEETVGDPAAAFAGAAFRHSGVYGLPQVAHNCLEPHGQICQWDAEGRLTAWCSTQAVSVLPGQFAEALEIPAGSVRAVAQYVGGGFGSKFAPDTWGIECARLARETGRPVKLMLDREMELAVGGDRPSLYARVEVAADADGQLVGWDGESWGTGGLGGAGAPPLPYVFEIPNRRHRHASIPTNVAAARAWRAPNHPQACYVTLSALDDLAAAAGLDPFKFLRRNLRFTGRLEPIYREELAIADRTFGWSKAWRPRPDPAAAMAAARTSEGPVRRGLGLSLHTWGGRGHRSTCAVTIHPDGTAEARLASQDIGTGTRTAVAVVLAETLGLPVAAVRVSLGDSHYPPSGPSGGSTTIGGVSASTRRGAQDALAALCARVAPELGIDPAELRLRAGRIEVAADPSRSLSWAEACARLGAVPLTSTGINPGPGELNDSGVGGVQMAEVTVDVETGVVRVERMLAVQDCGLVVDLLTAESQVLGGMIMGISVALSEEKVVDPSTGRLLSADLESYRLAGAFDVGELSVHLMTGENHMRRGPIGLGEPPVISPGAAIANAVANAIGVRVPYLPLTPKRVLDALEPVRAAGRAAS